MELRRVAESSERDCGVFHPRAPLGPLNGERAKRVWACGHQGLGGARFAAARKPVATISHFRPQKLGTSNARHVAKMHPVEAADSRADTPGSVRDDSCRTP